MLSRWHYFEIWLDFILYRLNRNRFSCLCVLYSNCVYVCGKRGGRTKKKKRKKKETTTTTGMTEETRGWLGRQEKVPLLLSQYESSLIMVSQNHAKLNNHRMEVCPWNRFPWIVVWFLWWSFTSKCEQQTDNEEWDDIIGENNSCALQTGHRT